MITKAAVGTTGNIVSTQKTRRGFILQNQSDTDIYFSAEGSADVTGPTGAKPGIKLTAGGSSFVAGPWSNYCQDLNRVIYAIHEGTGSKTLVIHEDIL